MKYAVLLPVGAWARQYLMFFAGWEPEDSVYGRMVRATTNSEEAKWMELEEAKSTIEELHKAGRIGAKLYTPEESSNGQDKGPQAGSGETTQELERPDGQSDDGECS